MRKSPRFWERTFASLGFVRRKNKKPRSRPRAGRPLRIEKLDEREMLSGAQPMAPLTTLYWDPNHTKTTTAGGNGTWDTTTANWYNAATNQDVVYNSLAPSVVFQGPAGIVTVSGTITVKQITINTNSGLSYGYTFGGGELLESPNMGLTINIGAGSATINSALQINGNYGVTKTGAGTLTLGYDGANFASMTVSTGTLEAKYSDSLPAYSAVSVSSSATLAVMAGGIGEWRSSDIDALRTQASFNAGSSLGIDTNDAASGFAYSSIIGNSHNGSWALGLVKLGANTLALGGANTYTGGTTVDGGVLSISNDDNLGASSGMLTLNGGTLLTTMGINSSRNVMLGSITGNLGGTVDTDGQTDTLNGSISGMGALTKTDSGTLVLDGSNTYWGGTTISGGELDADAAGALGSGAVTDNAVLAFDSPSSFTVSNEISVAGAASLTFNSSGTITVSGDISVATWASLTFNSSGTITVSGDISVATWASLIFDSSGPVTVSGEISGSGNLFQSGSGTVTLSGMNSFDDCYTVIENGTLEATWPCALGTSYSNISIDPNAVLAVEVGPGEWSSLSLDSLFSSNVSWFPGALLGIDTSNASGGVFTYATDISGTFGIAKLGTGTLILSGANNYSGRTTVSGGTLSISSDSNLGNPTYGLTLDGGTLETTAGITSSRTITVGSGGGTVEADECTDTFSGPVSGSNTLTITGNVGWVDLANTANFSGSFSILDGTTVQLGDEGSSLSNSVTMSDNAALVFANVHDVTYGGAISGDGAVCVLGPGKVTLTGDNSYIGGTYVYGGTLEAETTGSLPGYATSAVSVQGGATLAVMVGGTGEWNTGDIASLLANAFSPGAALGIDTTDGDFTYDGSISGSMGLTKTGPGTLTLTGTNTYTGTTIAAGGTLDLESRISSPIVVTDGRVTGTDAPLPLDSSGLTIENSACNNAAPSALTDGSLVLPFAPLGLNYISGSVNPQPIIAVDAQLQPGSGSRLLTGVETSLTLGTLSAVVENYTVPAGFNDSTDFYRFATQVDASLLSTGCYSWTMEVTETYSSGGPVVNTYTGQKDILNLSSSPFGAGWQLGSLDYLVTDANLGGVSLVQGNGTMAFFASNGQGGYVSPSGPLAFSTLTGNSGSGWTLTGTDGVTESFYASGNLHSITDQDGNQTTCSYNGYNGYGTLHTITDPAGRITTYGYSGGKCITVTDFAGRATTLGYNGGQLTSITQPDPNASGETQPVTSFTYWSAPGSAENGRMETSTDADNNTTTYNYDSYGTLSKVTNPDLSYETYHCVQAKALVAGTLYNPASLVSVSGVNATYTDESSHTTTYTFDRFGDPTSIENALRNTTTYAYNDNGQVTEETLPNTNDGSVPTTYCYDSDGNLVGETSPDGSTESWTYTTINNTYGGKLDAVATYTDGLGCETIYNYATTPYPGASLATGDLLSTEQVVGSSPDPNVDVDTQYAYTQLGGGCPAGLLLTEVDPLGIETAFTYNAHGLVIGVTYAVGKSDQASVSYGYDSYDNCVTSTNELGYETDYAYDGLDRLLSITGPAPDPINHPNDRPETTYLYDALGNAIQVSVEQSPSVWATTTYAYNYLGEVTQEALPDPTTGEPDASTYYSYTYTPTGQLDVVTNPLGGTTTYGYDAIGEETLVAQNDQNGNISTTQYTYDAVGRLSSSETPNGYTTSYTYTYSTSNHTLSVATTLPLVGTTTDVYDADGELVSVNDAMGYTTTYQYDKLGHPKPVTYNGVTLGPVYDKDGNVTSNTDLLGNSTSYTYNDLGEVLTETAPSPTGSGNVTTSYTYDLAGELLTVTDPLGNVTTYAYDPLGRVTSITTTPGPGQGGPTLTTSSTYDLAGDLLTSTDSGGNVTTYTYDTRGDQLSATDPDGKTTSYTYDALGDVLTLTDPPTASAPNGNTTTWTYDGLGRVITTATTSGSTSYRYDLDGNLSEKWGDADGPAIVYSYDSLDREKNEYFYADLADANNDPYRQYSEETLSYSYDAYNRLLEADDCNNVTGNWVDCSYSYQDVLGASGGSSVTAITTIDVGGNYSTTTLTSTYDNNDQLATLSATVNGTADFLNTYTYYADGQLKSVVQTGQWGGNSVTGKSAAFGYDADGRLTTVGRSQDVDGNYVTVANSVYTYDGDSRLTNLTYTDGSGNTLAGYEWTYNTAGNVTNQYSFKDSSGTPNPNPSAYATWAEATYNYDADGQLVSSGSTPAVAYTNWANAPTTDGSYNYDANGNRTEGSYTTGANNELTFDGTYYYSYDAEGNCQFRYKNATDAALDANASDITEYFYDNRNRLTEVKQWSTWTVYNNGNGTPDVEDVAYTYDAFDRLVDRIATVAIGGNPTTTEERYIYDGQNLVLVLDGYGNVTERELCSPAVDMVLASENASTNAVSWLLADNEGTVRDVATYNAGTGATTIADHLVYDAFGNMSQTTPAAQPRFTYTGQQFDAATGLYYYRARWYDAGMGRFMSQDPAGFSAGDANLYRYCGNSPVNEVDPSGQSMLAGSVLALGPMMMYDGPIGTMTPSCSSGGWERPVRSDDGGGPSEDTPDYGCYAVAGGGTWTSSGYGGSGDQGNLGAQNVMIGAGQVLVAAQNPGPDKPFADFDPNGLTVQKYSEEYLNLRWTFSDAVIAELNKFWTPPVEKEKPAGKGSLSDKYRTKVKILPNAQPKGIGGKGGNNSMPPMPVAPADPRAQQNLTPLPGSPTNVPTPTAPAGPNTPTPNFAYRLPLPATSPRQYKTNPSSQVPNQNPAMPSLNDRTPKPAQDKAMPPNPRGNKG